jgi:hypothetical protein
VDTSKWRTDLEPIWSYHDYWYIKPILYRISQVDRENLGIGYPISIPTLHEHHQKRIRDSRTGSEVFVNTTVVQLIQERPGVQGSRVLGAIIRREFPDGKKPQYLEVRAKLVTLATGGFQGSPSLKSQYLGQGGDNIFVRSNRGSVGDGLNLALSAGAESSRGMSTYYGHLLAAPLRAEDVDPEDFLPLAQYRKLKYIEQDNSANSEQRVDIAYSLMNPAVGLQTKLSETR